MYDWDSAEDVPWYSYLSQITSVTLNGSEVESIGAYAFTGCSSLEIIIIPVSVTEIGENAFSGCVGLTDVRYSGTVQEWNDNLADDETAFQDTSYTVSFMLSAYGVYGFTNPSDTISESICQEVLGAVAGHFRYLWSYDEPGGLCFGMAMTAAATLSYNKPFASSYWNSSSGYASTLRDITDGEAWTSVTTLRSAMEYIKYAMVYQHKTVSERSSDLDDLAQAAAEYVQSGGEPVLLAVQSEDDDYQHELLVLDIREKSDSKLELVVYDCNKESYTVPVYLYGSGGEYSSWEFDSYNSDNASLKYETTTDDFISYYEGNLGKTPAGYIYPGGTDIEVSVAGSESVLLNVSNSSALEELGIYVDESIGTDDNSKENYVYVVTGNSEITLTMPQDGASCIYVSADTGVSIDISGYALVTLNTGEDVVDAVTIENAEEETYTIGYYKASDETDSADMDDEETSDEATAILTTEISGSVTGTVTTQAADGGILISGDDLNITGIDLLNGEEVISSTELSEEDVSGETIYIGTDGESVEVSAVTELTDAQVSLPAESFTYTGSAIEPEVSVTLDDAVLTAGTHYTVSYSDNVDVGTASVTVTGKGAYTGTLYAEFTIEPCSIESASVSLSASSYTYNGSAKEPTPTVTMPLSEESVTLVKGTDYTVSYSSNTNAGTGYAVITGTGNFTGTVKQKFTISAQTLSSSKISLSCSSVTYSGNAKKPSVTVKNSAGKKLTKNTNYTVSYSSNTKTGKATVTIKGKGNYKGTVKKYFIIKPKKGTVSSVKSSAKKKATVKWKAFSGSVTKYQIQYRVKGTKTWKTVTVSGSKKSYTLTKLKSGKTYQVRIRAYKTISSKKYYGAWSSAKTVKVK